MFVARPLPDAQKFKEAFEKAQQENKVILESTKSAAPADKKEETGATEAKAQEKKDEEAAEAKAEETKA